MGHILCRRQAQRWILRIQAIPSCQSVAQATAVERIRGPNPTPVPLPQAPRRERQKIRIRWKPAPSCTPFCTEDTERQHTPHHRPEKFFVLVTFSGEFIHGRQVRLPQVCSWSVPPPPWHCQGSVFQGPASQPELACAG